MEVNISYDNSRSFETGSFVIGVGGLVTGVWCSPELGQFDFCYLFSEMRLRLRRIGEGYNPWTFRRFVSPSLLLDTLRTGARRVAQLRVFEQVHEYPSQHCLSLGGSLHFHCEYCQSQVSSNEL